MPFISINSTRNINGFKMRMLSNDHEINLDYVKVNIIIIFPLYSQI